MQAVILAGGLGTRLRPLTKEIPKVMVSVNGKPFLLHLLQLLKGQGMSDIVLCIGYLGQQVRDFFGNGEILGVNIRYSEEREKLLGTGGALKQAQNLLANYFLVINGDTYLPIDYADVEKTFLRRAKKALTVVYNNQEDTGTKNNVALDDNLMVIRYDKESPAPSLKYVDAGALVLRQEVLELIKEGSSVSLEEGLYNSLIQQGELAAYVMKQRFYDIGLPEQREILEGFLKGRVA
ncbi:MAG: sugar phosphate nucleotidyltransferase [Dehalococcoidales bacterium]